MRKLFILFLFLHPVLLFAQQKKGFIGQTKASSKNLTDPIDLYRTSGNISLLCNDLKMTPYIDLSGHAVNNNLVSKYAFWRLIKSNFNSLIIGNEDISKIGRYASLDISDDNSFSFSPYVFESSDKNIYRHNFSINFAGKLNDNKFFNLCDYRDLSVSLNYNHVLNWTNYKPKSNIDTNELNCKHKIQLDKLCEKFNSKERANDCFSETLKQKKKKELYNEFVDEFIGAETEIADDYWKSKTFWWYTIEFKALGRDEIKFLPKTLYSINNYSPKQEAIYTPGLKFSLNYFTVNNSTDNSFLFSIWIGGDRKHSLSEVMEPEDFQNFHSLNDSLFKIKDKESVFVTDFDKINTKIVLDYGVRLVRMFDFSTDDNRFKIGLSGSFARKGLVNDKKYPSLFRSEVGLVIPLIKSDGETSFNIELFRRWDIFSNFSADNDKFYGVRFNIPISN